MLGLFRKRRCSVAIAAAVKPLIESLEPRQMLSTTVPTGFVKLNSSPISVQSLSSAPTQTGITLESGKSYFVVASGSHVLAPGRNADAQTYMTSTSQSSWNLTAGPHLHVSGVST